MVDYPSTSDLRIAIEIAMGLAALLAAAWLAHCCSVLRRRRPLRPGESAKKEE